MRAPRGLLEASLARTKRAKKVVRNWATQVEDWATDHPAAWDPTEEMLENVVTMACPKSTWQTLMFTDISGLHCEYFLTPFSPEGFASGLALEKIHCEPLAIFSGQCKDAQLRWTRKTSIHPILSRCRRGEWMLVDNSAKPTLVAWLWCA